MSQCKEDKFQFSAHALERGLERMFNIPPPYTSIQIKNIEILIRKTMEWNELSCKWVLDDYKLDLIIRDKKYCVTIKPYSSGPCGSSKVSHYIKESNKLGKRKNFHRPWNNGEFKWE